MSNKSCTHSEYCILFCINFWEAQWPFKVTVRRHGFYFFFYRILGSQPLLGGGNKNKNKTLAKGKARQWVIAYTLLEDITRFVRFWGSVVFERNFLFEKKSLKKFWKIFFSQNIFPYFFFNSSKYPLTAL